MTRVAVLGALVMLSLPVCVRAAQQGAPTDYDCRLQRVVYNPSDVVELHATVGISTHLILDPDETYVTHAFGDSDAWTFAHKNNHFFIKPKEPDGDTNLTIVTDKRSYNFFIHYDAETKKACAQVFQVAFGYPDKDKARTVADTAKAKVTDDKAAISSEFKKPPESANFNYTKSATAQDQAIAPVNVWDDGRFTRFKFAGNAELPLIYARLDDGTEALVSTTQEGKAGRITVVPMVTKRFVLRLGTAVVGIYNEGFNGAGTAPESGTASEAVERKIKGAADGE